MIRTLTLALSLCFLMACWPVAEMRATRVQQKIERYQLLNPDQPVTPELVKQFEAEAKSEIEAEIAAEKAKALKQAAEAAAQVGAGAVTSNPIAVGTGGALLIGAIMMYFGVGRKGNGAITKKEE